MISKRIGLALAAATLAWLPAQPAYAIFHWCKGCGTPATAMYAPATVGYAPYSVGYAPPYVAAYAPAPCGSACVAPCAQTVNYVPQTAYRTVYYSTPVTAFSPVAACGPCGQTTVMRPVTTYVTQARLVPYMTYRPVVLPRCRWPRARWLCRPGPGGRRRVLRSGAPAAPLAARRTTRRRGDGWLLRRNRRSRGSGSGSRSGRELRSGSRRGELRSGPGPGSRADLHAADPDARRAELPEPRPRTQNTYPVRSRIGRSTTRTPNRPSKQQQQPEPQSRIVLPPRSENSSTSVPRALDPEDALDMSTALPSRQTIALRPVSTVAPKAAVEAG